MNRYYEVTYYTMAELLLEHDEDLTPGAIITETKKLTDALSNTPWGALTISTEESTCFKWLFTRVRDLHLFEGKDDKTYNAMFDKLMPSLITSKAKYKPILDAYTAALAKPGAMMAKVVSSNTTRNWFNDTPQSLNDSSEDLGHLTTFTKNGSDSENDISTPAARLAEIQSSIRAIYWDWTNEIIKRLCWEEGQ